MIRIRGKRLDMCCIFAGYLLSMALNILIWGIMYMTTINPKRKVIVWTNKYGEHWADVFCVVLVAVVSIIGLYYLLKLMKEEKDK